MESDTSSSSRTVRSKEPEQRDSPEVSNSRQSTTGKLQPCILWIFFYTNDKSYFCDIIGIKFFVV